MSKISELIRRLRNSSVVVPKDVEDAIAARDIKTIEKPKQNSRDPLILFLVVLSVPENMVRYPGTKGNTHGEKKDSAPKMKAKKIFTSIS